ncbi:MAG: hypothetical protein DWB59_13050, partial [Anaerolineae bacterium]|nr:hypothetical protein [Anaerolineae bacterium]
KGIVLCKDTPNFIGNRVAFGTGAFGMDFILKNAYTVDEVDAVTGPLIGNPRTATFRLIDLVGVDVWEHVGKNLAPLVQHDKLAVKYLQAEAPNKLIHTMVERGWLGNKSKVGFYKEVRAEGGKKEFWPLDLQTMEHVPPTKPRFESVGKAKDLENLGDRLKVMLEADDRAAKLVAALILQSFQYASSIIPEVADTAKPIDDAMRWGFMHEAGPFEMWDMLGVRDTAKRMKAAGYPAAKWVDAMLKAGVESFYQYKNGEKVGVYDVSKEKYVKIKRPAGVIVLKNFRGTKKMIAHNAGASLFDIGDGTALVEFHTKMNALDEDISNIVGEALDRVEKDFDGLVIGNEADNFSAGANLFMVVVAAQQGMWDTLDGAVRGLQNMNMRMRYFPKPVVVAPAGLALGGGCEIAMHAPRVVAASETYIGLVELGAGVIPAGGGPVPSARVSANRSGEGRHLRGGGALDGYSLPIRPNRDEPRTPADRSQTRSVGDVRGGVSSARARVDLCSGPRHVRRDEDRRVVVGRHVVQADVGQRAVHPGPGARSLPVAVRRGEDAGAHVGAVADGEAVEELIHVTCYEIQVTCYA